MKRFVEDDPLDQAVLFPEHLDDWIAEDNPARAVDAFVDELDFMALGFDGVEPADTGRPAYHPGTLLKIYIYGCLNRIQSSRRLERQLPAGHRTARGRRWSVGRCYGREPPAGPRVCLSSGQP